MRKYTGDLAGRRLTVTQYREDYRRRYADTRNTTSWKLERQQTFIEPNNDSWQEFDRGNWEGSLARFRDRMPRLLVQAREDAERGMELYRVRVVAEPLSPYLLWELNALKIRGECGEKIRVVDVGLVEEFERDGEIPEILTLGGETVYQILYNADGALEGAVCSTERSEVKSWVSFIERLYVKGEEIESFFARRVAGRKPSNAA
jgi:hypothetical protein